MEIAHGSRTHLSFAGGHEAVKRGLRTLANFAVEGETWVNVANQTLQYLKEYWKEKRLNKSLNA